MNSAVTTAHRLADLLRRVEALERTSRLPRSSIDGGALTINNDEGLPLVVIGDQYDGTYGVRAYNGAEVTADGGRIVANDLDLPEGTITETMIADDQISTPKLTANAVTADKIAAGAITADKVAANAITAGAISAGAIDGQTITGATLIGGEVIAGTAGEIKIDNDGIAITNPDDDGNYVRLEYLGSGNGAAMTLAPGEPHMLPGGYASPATISAEQIGNFESDPGGRYAPTLRLMSPYVPAYPDPADDGPVVSTILMRGADEDGRPAEIEMAGAKVIVDQALHVGGPALFAEGRLTRPPLHAASTAARSLTSTTYDDLTGASITVTTLRPGALYLALWSADYELTTAGAATATTRLLVGGTALPQLALANFANVTTGARMSAAQFAIGTLGAAGNHVLKLQANRAVGTGTVRVNATHTTLTVIVFE